MKNTDCTIGSLLTVQDYNLVVPCRKVLESIFKKSFVSTKNYKESSKFWDSGDMT